MTFIHIVLTTATGFGLWRLWRLIAATDGRVAAIVGAGFLLRVVGAQVLYWISWLELPIARSLQLGDGLWFFALDAQGYFAYADSILRQGLGSVLTVDAVYPSHFFVQVLTLCVAAFGQATSVAILLNGFAFLITCLVIVRLGTRDGRVTVPGLAALAAIAFGPGAILWSLQPLKDTLLMSLMAVMVAACTMWWGAYRSVESPTSRWRLIVSGAAMLIVMYALSGLRWYFGAIIWAAVGAFFVLTAAGARRRWPAALASIAVFVLLAQALRLGGADDVSPWVRRILDPRTAVVALPATSRIPGDLVEARKGFENTPGATTIAAGSRLAPTTKKSPPGRELARAEQPSTQSPAESDLSAEPAAPDGLRDEQVLPAPGSIRGAVLRLAVGLVALVVPRTVAEAMGLIRVGGGRGLWPFVELDTIAFDLVLLFAMVYCLRRLRALPWTATPLFAMLVIVLVATAVPMAYTVDNFGTLLRLRQMLYGLAVFLPLALSEAVTARALPLHGKDA